MAVSGMTIIAEREKYVDFTVRYMDYGVGIILSKPKPTSANTLGEKSDLSMSSKPFYGYVNTKVCSMKTTWFLASSMIRVETIEIWIAF